MIIMEDVTKTYSTGVAALNGINLHIQKGEFVFIVGKSGSGKSTLIKLLLKELDPTSGKIYVNKKYLNKITRKKLPSKAEYAINAAGLIILLGFMCVVTFSDITKLF